MSADLPTLSAYQGANAARYARTIAEDLRDLADKVERHAASLERGPRISHVFDATSIVTALHNALPNLHISNLIEEASGADAALAQEKND